MSYRKGGLGCDSRNSTGLLAGRVVKEKGRKFWVSSSLRQWPKQCLVFCGVRMDSVLISQPSLGTLHVREAGIRLGSHLMLSAIPCCSFWFSVFVHQPARTDGTKPSFKGSRRWKKMGLSLLGENSFIATATWFLKNCSMVGKWEISPKRKRHRVAEIINKYLSWSPGSSHLVSVVWGYSTKCREAVKNHSLWSAGKLIVIYALRSSCTVTRLESTAYAFRLGKASSQKLCWVVGGSKRKTRI